MKNVWFVVLSLLAGCASVQDTGLRVGVVATEVRFPSDGRGYGKGYFRVETPRTLDAKETASAEQKRRVIRCDRIGKAFDAKTEECVDP